VVRASDWWPLVDIVHRVQIVYVKSVFLRFHCFHDHLIPAAVNNCVASVAFEKLGTPWMNTHLAGLTEPVRCWRSKCLRLNMILVLHAVIPVSFLFSPLSPLSPSFASSQLFFCFPVGFPLRLPFPHPALCFHNHLPGRLVLVACGWQERGLPVD
jgi:hypothetical protein